MELGQLRRFHQQVAENNVEIVAISADPPEVSEALRRRLDAPFIFLSDHDGELLDRLNIRHLKGYGGKDIAFPTAIVVDEEAFVRWTYEMPYGNMRTTPAELLEAIERLTLEEHDRELRWGGA